ncbi:phosphate acyltransferase PlsX [Mycoplasma sp. Ms02]|uniref:phosphate acyltransferase PlsX n=1 Tax=Mycoplasma sp. Ms02 TaxID=353851 RepID=UPI001C88F8A2|nr:phosphate acyltransferase PlsX [Mycoplasma sp. Ms02]QZE12294.1 phosphate acyltransferase PlsX [Mycoplasma sp. Ms02]
MNKKPIIVIDANGNDHGPSVIAQAISEFLNENPNFSIYIVGDKKELDNHLLSQVDQFDLHIVDNDKIAKLSENPRLVLKEDSSMKQALELFKEKEADAFISSGDSGSLLTLSTFIAKRIDGVSRPAFMPFFPTIQGRRFLLLDVGANISVKPEFLYEWGIVASEYSKAMLGTTNPKVALLNIGTESYKGPDFIQEAKKMLEESNLNYQGFTESKELLRTDMDVILCDGYAGNMALKAYEGALLSVKDLLESSIKAKVIRMIGYLLAKGAFKNLAKKIEFRDIGGAFVVGINGIVIKSHGSSDKRQFKGAIYQAKKAIETNLLQKVKDATKDKINNES